MGKGTPTQPAWTRSLGAMIAAGVPCRAMCDTCPAWRDVDLAALAGRIGADATLWNRTTRCRLTPDCGGRNRFYVGGRGRMEPMRD